MVDGDPVQYDGLVALTALTVIGLVWYTYYTRETLEHARATSNEARRLAIIGQDQKREAFATAVLAELFSLTARLKVISEHGPQNFESILFSHPMLQRACEALELFSADTIASLASTIRQIEDVQGQLDLLPALRLNAKDQSLQPGMRQAAEDRRVATQEGLRVRATWAFNRAVILQQHLTSQGGKMPDGLGEAAVPLFKRPPLSPDPFIRPTQDQPNVVPTPNTR